MPTWLEELSLSQSQKGPRSLSNEGIYVCGWAARGALTPDYVAGQEEHGPQAVGHGPQDEQRTPSISERQPQLGLVPLHPAQPNGDR